MIFVTFQESREAWNRKNLPGPSSRIDFRDGSKRAEQDDILGKVANEFVVAMFTDSILVPLHQPVCGQNNCKVSNH